MSGREPTAADTASTAGVVGIFRLVGLDGWLERGERYR
jgi:hypothetical protein